MVVSFEDLSSWSKIIIKPTAIFFFVMEFIAHVVDVGEVATKRKGINEKSNSFQKQGFVMNDFIIPS